MRLLLRAALVLALSAAACGRKPFDATPEGVTREYFERMERVQGDPKDARLVFDILSRQAQTNLSDRARRASAASGKRMGPEQMITPSHWFSRFQPRQWATRAAGSRAVVEVQGLDPETERAEVPCVLEDGRWRIDLALPALPPIEHRPGSEAR